MLARLKAIPSRGALAASFKINFVTCRIRYFAVEAHSKFREESLCKSTCFSADGNMYNLTRQHSPSGFDKVGFQLSPILAQPD